MQEIIAKVWTLSGFFYTSLAASILVFYKSKRLRNFLNYAVIFSAAILAIFLSVQAFAKHLRSPGLFFRPIEQKVDQATLSQASFAVKIKEAIPSGATVCIYIALPSLYLGQELYPHKPFYLPNDQMPPTRCQYVVSQLTRRRDLEKYLILSHQNNFLYKLAP